MRAGLLLVMFALPLAAQVRERPVAERCSVLDPSCVPPRLPREFRGVWIASVANIDWPSEPGLPTAESKRELIALLDRSKSSGLNAVIFQVRPAADALYESDIEPWSEYLTGRQGVPPRPFWDPLGFAVAEAHKRGLELHAWFNPYRARHPSAKGPLSAGHVANKRPAMVRTYGAHRWMDPGDETVRAHTVRVILDVVQRYDIDGVHIDDYFYPYKERDRRGRVIEFPDSITYARYRAAGGMLARDDWRRDNVDRLVEELYRSIHDVKPWVKFGVSPFGIWRPGFPAQIQGFDAYTELYADARRWLREGWVDYFAPQLYWSMAQEAQSYPALLRWWTQQNDFSRHIWPGNYTNRVGEPSRTAWLTPEIEAQIDATRVDPGASGNIHFSAKVFLEDRDSLATRLGARLYLGPALVPASPWLRVAPQEAPVTEIIRTASGAMTLRVTPAGDDAPRWWLLQLRSRAGVWTSELVPADVRELQIPLSADRLSVRAIDKVAMESPQVAYRW
jgi:uncharacterized lipoprotein YddW (UPF0748 family)